MNSSDPSQKYALLKVYNLASFKYVVESYRAYINFREMLFFLVTIAIKVVRNGLIIMIRVQHNTHERSIIHMSAVINHISLTPLSCSSLMLHLPRITSF